MPSTLTRIGDYAFDNTNITSLTLKGNSLTEIGTLAFCQTDIKGDLTIPASVQTIKDNAFQETHISKLTFSGENLIEIGNSAFKNDDWGTTNPEFLNCELVLPASLQKIGDSAFKGSHITKLTFEDTTDNPSKLTSIGPSAFAVCKSVKGDLIIPDSVTSIGDRAFRESGFDGTLKLPENSAFTKIEKNTFYQTKFTGTLNIPENVKRIYDGAFFECNGFTSITLNDGLEEITCYDGNCDDGDYKGAFANCSNIAGDLIIPDSVTSIGDSAFNGCTNLNGKLQVSKNITSIGDRAFNQCDFSELFICSKELKEVKERAFYLKNNAESGTLILPIGVTYTGSWQFYNCSRVTTLYYPVEFTTLPNYKQTGIDGKTTYTDYDDLRTKLGADLAKQLGVDTW